MLKHPLPEAFLQLKWHLTKRYFFMNLLFYFIFLVSLTSLAGLHSSMIKCGENVSGICHVPKEVAECSNGRKFGLKNFRVSGSIFEGINKSGWSN